MKNAPFATLLTVLVSLFGALACQQRQEPPRVAIENVTVIDVVSGSAAHGVTVQTSGERITAIGAEHSVPDRAIARVDGTGKFLIPGLWDLHSHNQASGEASLALYLANGVVGTRDMGSDVDFILPLRDRIMKQDLLGPEVIAAGPILDDAPADWPFRRRVKTAEDGRQAVRDLQAAGVDLIKAHNFTPREAFFAIIDEAKRRGLPVAGHIPLQVSLKEGIEAVHGVSGRAARL